MDCQVQEHGASWCHPSYMPLRCSTAWGCRPALVLLKVMRLRCLEGGVCWQLEMGSAHAQHHACPRLNAAKLQAQCRWTVAQLIVTRPDVRWMKCPYQVLARLFVIDSTAVELSSAAFLAFRAAFFFAALDFAPARAPSRSAHEDASQHRRQVNAELPDNKYTE